MPLIRKHKVCAECGKSESDHWSRHWSRHHPDKQKKALAPGESPSNPYDESWMYLIEPLSLREKFVDAAPLADSQPNDNLETQREDVAIASTEPSSLDADPKFIEIDDASSDPEPIEDHKSDCDQQIFDDDFQSLPTNKLFKMAEKTLHIIQERLKAREAKARDELRAELRQPTTIWQPQMLPLFTSIGSCHLSLSRASDP